MVYLILGINFDFWPYNKFFTKIMLCSKFFLKKNSLSMLKDP
jgi:hypothetical protein